jgi:hypothetical protein
MHLPEILAAPFGEKVIEGSRFAQRWHAVGEDQSALLVRLGQMKSPLVMMDYLAKIKTETWTAKREDYEQLLRQLRGLNCQIDKLRKERQTLYTELRQARKDKVEAERLKGQHFRDVIFEKSPSSVDLKQREKLTSDVSDRSNKVLLIRSRIRELLRQQSTLAGEESVLRLHSQRRKLECEVEMERLKLIREAVTASEGLARANNRPSAWWFPVVCSDGEWFRQVIDTAEFSLEPLT